MAQALLLLDTISNQKTVKLIQLNTIAALYSGIPHMQVLTIFASIPPKVNIPCSHVERAATRVTVKFCWQSQLQFMTEH